MRNINKLIHFWAATHLLACHSWGGCQAWFRRKADKVRHCVVTRWFWSINGQFFGQLALMIKASRVVREAAILKRYSIICPRHASWRNHLAVYFWGRFFLSILTRHFYKRTDNNCIHAAHDSAGEVNFTGNLRIRRNHDMASQWQLHVW